MATFSGNAAGYRIDHLANGTIRVVDIDSSDGDTGKQIVTPGQELQFADQSFSLDTYTESRVESGPGYTPGSFHDVAAMPDGGYLVTYDLYREGISGIFGQRYDAAGNKVGEETLISDVINSGQSVIAVLADGSYVVAWESTAGYGSIYAQRFDASGNPLGPEKTVVDDLTDSPADVAITALEGGGFVITWTSYDDYMGPANNDIYATRFNAAGDAVGDHVRINASKAGQQTDADVTGLADGGYVITWTSASADGKSYDVFAKRFDDHGHAVGGETLVHTEVDGYQGQPEVTALADGSYIITWVSGSSDHNVFAKHYDADEDDEPGDEIQVNTTTQGSQHSPAVTAFADGSYIVAWETDGTADADGLYLQRFDASDNKVGGETRINARYDNIFIGDWASGLAITALADGAYVATWTTEYGLMSQYVDKDGNAKALGDALNGSDADNTINAGVGKQFIFGNGGADILNGGSGNDALFGGDGDDTLNGGEGNDTLWADGQSWSENGTNHVYGGAGNDTLLGYGYGSDNLLSGGDGNDLIEGGFYRATLRGGAGNDTLLSGSGDDMYGDAGDDRLEGDVYSDNLYGGVGNDFLMGGGSNDTLEGDAGIDTLLGNIGNDTLSGGDGADILNGGKESDRLTGGGGKDVFIFDQALLSNIDTITDFAAGFDSLQLGHAVFAALGTGALAASQFAANADGLAMDADDYIIYETDTGKLFYDKDGNGAGVKVQFAVLIGNPALMASDIEVV